MLCKVLVVLGTCIVIVSRAMYYMRLIYVLFRKALCVCCAIYMLWDLVLSSCRSDNCHVVSCELRAVSKGSLYLCVPG